MCMKTESHLNVCSSVYACTLCICVHICAPVQHGEGRPEGGVTPQAVLFFEIGSLIALGLTMHARLAGQKVL